MARKPFKTLSIGIDQSLQNTGIAIATADGLYRVGSVDLHKVKGNTIKRQLLRSKIAIVIGHCKEIADNTIVICERCRLFSQQFISQPYIMSCGALLALIQDVCYDYDVQGYTVDTRAWKKAVLGTAQPCANRYNVPPEKWLSVQYVIAQGFGDKISIPATDRQTKDVTVIDGRRIIFNHDAADAACIARYWFMGARDKLEPIKV